MGLILTRRCMLMGVAATALLPSYAFARTVTVYNSSDLQRALANAQPGHRIVVRNGSYSGTFRLTKSGTSGSKIIIEAASQQQAVIRSSMLITGNHVVVSGLTFTGGHLTVKGADCRITRCLLKGGPSINARGTARIEIDHNELTGWSSRGIDCDPYHEGKTGYYVHVHHNYLHSSRKGNDLPGISVGRHTGHHKRPVKAIIEYNLLENCPGGQTIRLKSSDNIVRNNTLINCESVSNRFGLNNKFINNWLEGCRALRLRDINCVAEGNKLINCIEGLVVGAGDVTSAQLSSKRDRHPTSDRCQLINNDANRTIIGRTYSDFKPVLPAMNTVVRGHKGPIIYGAQRGTNIVSSSQSSSKAGARKLKRSDVGLRAR